MRSTTPRSIAAACLAAGASLAPGPAAAAETTEPPADPYTSNVAIVVWDGAEILDWGGPAEVFESASRFGASGDVPAFRVYTVSKTTEPIVSQRFVSVNPQYSIENAPPPDVIVLPGGGTGSVLDDPRFLAWVGQAAREAEVALSVCTGAFILARAGLLDGREATTWYGALDRLQREFPGVTVHRGRRRQQAGLDVRGGNWEAAMAGLQSLVSEDPSDLVAWMELGGAAYGAGEYARAGEAYERAAAFEPLARRAWYNAACSFALAGRHDRALDGLAKAIAAGFDDAGYLAGDDDLASLRDDPRFEKLVDSLQ